MAGPRGSIRLVRHICGACGQLYGGAGNCANDGTLLMPASDDVMLGQTIGNYRITRLIGAGGMGRVYAAAQPSIGARVAIKVLRP
jgi:serine/threonine protein kinase